MHVMKTVEIPAKTIEQIGYVVCDLCEKQSSDGYWGERFSDVAETEVSMKIGSSCPSGGNHTETEFDICTDCFKDVLVPFLKSKGAEPRVEERDY